MWREMEEEDVRWANLCTHPPGAVAKARNMGQAPFGTWTMAVAGDTRGTRNIPF